MISLPSNLSPTSPLFSHFFPQSPTSKRLICLLQAPSLKFTYFYSAPIFVHSTIRKARLCMELLLDCIKSQQALRRHPNTSHLTRIASISPRTYTASTTGEPLHSFLDIKLGGILFLGVGGKGGDGCAMLLSHVKAIESRE